jgi:hypothetical protein
VHRAIPTISKELNHLHEERDHLLIRISLEGDKSNPSQDRLSSMRLRLRKMNEQIAEARAKLVF